MELEIVLETGSKLQMNWEIILGIIYLKLEITKSLENILDGNWKDIGKNYERTWKFIGWNLGSTFNGAKERLKAFWFIPS